MTELEYFVEFELLQIVGEDGCFISLPLVEFLLHFLYELGLFIHFENFDLFGLIESKQIALLVSPDIFQRLTFVCTESLK